MKMNKILVPVVFHETSLRMVHQAAYLARHFHSEIIPIVEASQRPPDRCVDALIMMHRYPGDLVQVGYN